MVVALQKGSFVISIDKDIIAFRPRTALQRLRAFSFWAGHDYAGEREKLIEAVPGGLSDTTAGFAVYEEARLDAGLSPYRLLQHSCRTVYMRTFDNDSSVTQLLESIDIG